MMRTMASVWFSVIVLVSLQKVYGNVCLKNNNKFTCNECVRCGGDWCNEPGVSPHCVFSLEDGWCPDHREALTEVDEVMRHGDLVSPVYAERTLYIGKPNRLDIHYISKNEQKAKMMIVQSTQSFNIELNEYHRQCTGINCTTTIEAMPSQDFCNATGGVSETVLVRINVGSDEEVQVKYHVPCACECSLTVQKNAPLCNKNGDFYCGVCSCYPGWTGEYCNQQLCDGKRGDIVQCSISPKNDQDCSGNGYCGLCETCICYTDREGSQYFEQANNCADLCYQITSECEDCFLNSTANTARECLSKNCHHDFYIHRYNESLTKERDALDRKIWVFCSDTIDDCSTNYFAKKDDNEEIHVMIVSSCNDVNAIPITVEPSQVPIILGVLGILAVVATVGGVMLWKHMNTVPPVPLNDPQYQNIDAEDCTGENPLYKPPTSSFKNPTYGKW